MATNPTSGFIQRLRIVLRDGAGLTDGQLLADYLGRRDEAAVAALVRRHGPMVWGVCRRVLHNHHDAEDAFQTTFLVLVRKAASIASRELLANWLYGVAHQTALKARATVAKRKGRERPMTETPEPAVLEQELWRDLQPLLDEELSRLPAKYRSVVVLCDLEGKTRKEAARQLGCPEGTVAGRLARARLMLAKRLTRRGVALSGGALAGVLSQQAASAGVQASVVSSTIKAASLFAVGKAAAAGVISPKVAALTEGVLKTMLLSKLKVMALVVVAALSGAAGLIYQTRAAEPPKAQAATGKADKQEQPAKNQKPKPDEEQLRGTWKLVKAEENGKSGTLKDGDPLGAVFTVRGETLHMKITGEKGALETDRFFVFKLNTTTTPKLIDLADWQKGFEDDNKVLEGVYSLDGDALTICFADGSLGENPVGSEKNRPTALRSEEGSNTTVWWLKREAEANKSTGRAAAKAGAENKETKEAAAPKEPTKTKEAAAANELDGSYTVIEAIEAGKKKPGQSTYAARLRKCQVIIKEGILSFVLGDPDIDGKRGDVKFTLDPSKNPGRIDLKPLPPEGSELADPSLTLPGIYRVKKTDQGLELTIAWMASPQGNRPENFDAKAPAEVMVRLLWRGKFETTPPPLPPEGSE